MKWGWYVPDRFLSNKNPNEIDVGPQVCGTDKIVCMNRQSQPNQSKLNQINTKYLDSIDSSKLFFTCMKIFSLEIQLNFIN